MIFRELIAALAEADNTKEVVAVFAAFIISHTMTVAPFLIGIAVLVSIDLYTGIRAAQKRGEAIRSKGLQQTTIKIKDYFLAILVTHVSQLIWFPDFGLVYIVSMYIAVTELKSNLENISETTGTNLWVRLIEKLPFLNITKADEKDKKPS